ncbi:selenocysteine-specific elongation factor isoform X2 [Halyomorpha halys]|uniref:selenocysteine-specific elongation factor isoform X2 n=1 Tax=Halyomorpha halys TaxID=286706 RepID=UPI0006D51B5E|nr:selenocysteine-specific elongation factor isoform X2 [Halyomorpha halys]
MTKVQQLNINIGLLGHVDSGKTSLAKCLSQINSTACFDKHPQSQERGITIDLGFSSFSTEASENFKKHGYEKIQFTLVDCPGHASLIRTIIGGIDNLITKLTEVISVPCRSSTNPLVLAIDHCFSIKGKGTVITGTILQGKISLNDIIEIPGLQETKKVKSIQMFKQDVSTAVQGDRIGTCVTHFNPKQLERGIACRPGYMHLVHGVIINFNKVKYYKNIIKSNTKYHVSVGYETLIGKLLLFQSEDNPNFNLENEYLYVEQFNEEMSAKVFALLEFEKSIYFPPNSIIICSKLDANINCNTCRISFFGNVVYEISDKRYPETFLPKLKIYKVKIKTGYVQSLINENEIIAHKLFQKITSAQKFLNMKIKLSTGETGYIESTFGQKDKIRIRIPEGLQASTFEYLSLTKKGKKNKVKSEKEESLKEPKPKVDSVTVRLEFKRYMFDKHKTITQHT